MFQDAIVGTGHFIVNKRKRKQMRKLITTLAMVIGLSRVAFAPFEQIPGPPLGSSSNPIYIAPSPYNVPEFNPRSIQTQPVIVPTPAPQPQVIVVQPQPQFNPDTAALAILVRQRVQFTPVKPAVYRKLSPQNGKTPIVIGEARFYDIGQSKMRQLYQLKKKHRADNFYIEWQQVLPNHVQAVVVKFIVWK